MKKKIIKKLVLNKKTIFNLSENEMYMVRGATIFLNYCTNSCSLFIACCPHTEENVIEQNPDEG